MFAKLPRMALWLGSAGLAPFVALSIACLILRGEAQGWSGHALAAYGATILAFLGGLHWGFALSPGEVRPDPVALAVGVAPQLMGWAALLLPLREGLLVLAAALLAALWLDSAATRRGRAPAWLLSLRLPLSTAAALCCGAAVMGF